MKTTSEIIVVSGARQVPIGHYRRDFSIQGDVLSGFKDERTQAIDSIPITLPHAMTRRLKPALTAILGTFESDCYAFAAYLNGVRPSSRKIFSVWAITRTLGSHTETAEAEPGATVIFLQGSEPVHLGVVCQNGLILQKFNNYDGPAAITTTEDTMAYYDADTLQLAVPRESYLL